MMMLMTVARLGSCLLFAFLGVRGEALAGETMLYSEYISLIRQSANPYKYAIFYCGSRQNYIVDKLLSPEVNRHRLPVIFVAANDDVTSPISGRMVKGKDIWNLYHGAAGNIIFLNDQGHPIQGGFIPQIVHTNDPEIIRAHIEYIVAYGGRQPSISFQEYVRGIGLEDRFLEATQRYRHGFLGGMLSSAFPGTYVRGMTTDGNILDPWQG
ncbi:MAG: hypothetical protein N3A02_02535, partial [Rectinema sp.]|nr:hypothetical protein [Rectinema sp.]